MKKGSTERPVKPTSFEFITFSNLSRMRDAAAKSQIRKHAMKDIGVTRRRPDKRRRGCIEVPLELLPRMAAPSPVVTSIGYAAIDPFLKYPVELDHVGKELVANMFEYHQGAMWEDWFNVALNAKSAFYQAMANASLHLGILRQPERSLEEFPVAIKYHLLAVSSVRTQLEQSNGRATHETLGCITAILFWTTGLREHDQWNVQMNGLLELMRTFEGGYGAIAKNKHLRSTISWLEVRGAYTQDIRPRIPLPEPWLEEFAASLPTIPDTEHDNFAKLSVDEDWTASLQTHSAVVDAYRELLVFSRKTINDVSNHNIGQKSLRLPAWVNVMIYKLLLLRPMEIDPNGREPVAGYLAESLRLAMLLYMAPIWRYYGANPIHTHDLVQKLYELIELRLANVIRDESLQKLHVWVLCMGAFEASAMQATVIQQYFLNAIAEVPALTRTRAVGARDLLWIPGLFDEHKAILERDIERVLEPKCSDFDYAA